MTDLISNLNQKKAAAMTIGFIGGGNMAAALIGGLRARQAATRFVVIEPYEASRTNLLTKFGVTAHAAIDAAAQADLAACDVIVLAVKPQQMRAAIQPLALSVAGKLIISIAAGIRTQDIARWLGGHRLIVRCMPNTPALIGAGMTGLCATSDVSVQQRQQAEMLLSAVGTTLWLDREDQLDAVTALSGSGPAYVFYFIEAMQRAGLELGLSTAAARQLALTTFTGAATLAAQSDEEASVLRQRVTSKGGTTYAALTSMEADQLGDAIVRAIHAAAKRSKELGDELGQD